MAQINAVYELRVVSMFEYSLELAMSIQVTVVLGVFHCWALFESPVAKNMAQVGPKVHHVFRDCQQMMVSVSRQ